MNIKPNGPTLILRDNFKIKIDGDIYDPEDAHI
jgi:hypothetical protein